MLLIIFITIDMFFVTLLWASKIRHFYLHKSYVRVARSVLRVGMSKCTP